ncbi:hypothetical protein ES332_A12G051100v1 [Gossypium tomentosum]|uniref:TLC domain-containing protein n=1 Tax=Gossypium tomentosum TaxID=34277 RepID=A0A5D2MTJ3_GOSTO|nr:hypothetical protein ES332_A12G051100v1 [Gossypium tomentosum]
MISDSVGRFYLILDFFLNFLKFCYLLPLFSQTSFTLFSSSFSFLCRFHFLFLSLVLVILFLRSIIAVVLHFVMPLVFRTILGEERMVLDEPPAN